MVRRLTLLMLVPLVLSAQVDKVKNFAKGIVSAGYDASATTIVLTSGHGARFPQPSTDGAFYAVWWNATQYSDPSDDPNREIVRVTARSSDSFTITRGQDGTSAATHNLPGRAYYIMQAITAGMQNAVRDTLASFDTRINDRVPKAASTRYVSPSYNGNSPWHATLLAAVAAAQSGDVIRVEKGIYTDDIAPGGKKLYIEAAQGAVLEHSWRIVSGDSVYVTGGQTGRSTNYWDEKLVAQNGGLFSWTTDGTMGCTLFDTSGTLLIRARTVLSGTSYKGLQVDGSAYCSIVADTMMAHNGASWLYGAILVYGGSKVELTVRKTLPVTITLYDSAKLDMTETRFASDIPTRCAFYMDAPKARVRVFNSFLYCGGANESGFHNIETGTSGGNYEVYNSVLTTGSRATTGFMGAPLEMGGPYTLKMVNVAIIDSGGYYGRAAALNGNGKVSWENVSVTTLGDGANATCCVAFNLTDSATVMGFNNVTFHARKYGPFLWYGRAMDARDSMLTFNGCTFQIDTLYPGYTWDFAFGTVHLEDSLAKYSNKRSMDYSTRFLAPRARIEVLDADSIVGNNGNLKIVSNNTGFGDLYSNWNVWGYLFGKIPAYSAEKRDLVLRPGAAGGYVAIQNTGGGADILVIDGNSVYINQLLMLPTAGVQQAGNWLIGSSRDLYPTTVTASSTISGAKFYVSSLNTPPATAGDPGTAGEIRFGSDGYLYLCTATNTWNRVQLTTW